ncbi:MAG: carboxypeptidase regulatory-like domain-containing protein [Myxococcales bacterium]|nr:carboxypeptidase regulatory-like domain-containing protein [Myxococcales bacterium]
MRRRPLCCSLAVLLAALAGAGGCEEPDTRDLLVNVSGEAYPRVRCGRGPKKLLGALYPDGAPIANAEVVLKPGNLRARTNAAGQARLRAVPAGNYTLYVTKDGQRPQPPTKIKLPQSDNQLSIKMLPCMVVSPKRAVGFGKTITLSPNNLCGKDWDDAQFTWRQLEGPKIEQSVKTWNQRQLTFTMADIEKARGGLPVLPTVLSFSHDQAGEYVFELQARNSKGLVAKAYGYATSTDAVSGMTSVPPGRRYYFAGDPTGPWSWKLVSQPNGWKVTVEGQTTRTPSVVPVANGPITAQSTVVLQETNKLLTFSLVVGDWNVVRRDCGRSECHAAMEGNWKGTTHARSWQRLLDGELKLDRGPASERCAECHSMGYHPTIDDGGYDDIARRNNIKFPSSLKDGNFAKLPDELKNVSNVYCLSCHGPARVDPPVAEQPGLFQVGVCARCHDRLPEQLTVAQWRLSKHAKTVGTDINGPDRRPECAKCHTAQGFYYAFAALSRPHSAKTAVLTCCENPAPITCQGCHNAMIAGHEHQLHRAGSLTLPSGLELTKVGGTALCATCHNAGHDPDKTQTLDERLAPHAPQADLTYGRAGYSLDVSGVALPALAGIACAKKTKKGCIDCHMHPGPPLGSPGVGELGGHTFRMRKDKLINIGACRGCHSTATSFDLPAKGDYDGDGKKSGIRDEIAALMNLLDGDIRAAIAKRAYKGCGAARDAGVGYKVGYRNKIVVVDAKGRDLGDCDGSGGIERLEVPFTFPLADLELHKAAYNYLVLAKDRSGGVHNAPYAVKLLQRSIAALRGGKNLPSWVILE